MKYDLHNKIYLDKEMIYDLCLYSVLVCVYLWEMRFGDKYKFYFFMKG